MVDPPANLADRGSPSDSDAGVAVVSGEGGTIDTGREAGAITVCGGSTGDPKAVPILEWHYYPYSGKYVFPVGARCGNTEPARRSATAAIVSGTIEEDTTATSVSTFGDAPFNSVGGYSKSAFSDNAMPETDLGAPIRLGWSNLTNLFYFLGTEGAVSEDGWQKHYRVAGWSGHFSNRAWSLSSPKRLPSIGGSDDDYFASRITAAHGVGWLFTVAFDAECKATMFDALVGRNPLDMLAPEAPHTRQEISNFLVDNNARMVLTVFTTGDSDPAIPAALTGTRASAATLDDLETTLKAFKAALDANARNVGPADYASIVAGTNPHWVIGSVTATPISSLP